MTRRRIQSFLKVNYKVFEPLEFSPITELRHCCYHQRNDTHAICLRTYIASMYFTRSSDKISTPFKRGAFVVIGFIGAGIDVRSDWRAFKLNGRFFG